METERNNKKYKKKKVRSKNKVKSPLINKIERSRLYQIFQNKEVKRYTVVTISAIVIGLVFGLTTLKILNHVGQPQGVGAITSHVDNDSVKDTGKEINQKIPSLQAYIIQGGVFSNAQNAAEWKEHLQHAGFDVVNWKRDDLYYLLIGLATTEGELSDLKSELEANDLEVYIKMWETNEHNVNLEQEDLNWIDSFLSLWLKSVENTEGKDQLLNEEWHSLLSTDLEISENLQVLRNDIDTFLKEVEPNNAIEKQYGLLKIWHLFEQFISSNES